VPDVRQCAQEVISAHVLAKDYRMRDALIEEYVEAHGPELLACIYEFVYTHAVASVEEAAAQNHFYFMLDGLGSLIESIAGEQDEDGYELAVSLCTMCFEDEDEVAPERVEAMKAAQTCLVVHMLVRQGGEPWGVQQHLDLADMCVVVHMFGDIMWTLVKWVREPLGDPFVIKELLAGVGSILRALARSQNVTLSMLISDYWGKLALDDCAQDQ